MNYMFPDLVQALVATVSFILFLLPPGFLFGWTTDIMSFRGRSIPERVLWSLVLSLPLALLVSVYGDRYLFPAITLVLFIVVAVASAVILVSQAIQNGVPHGREFDKPLAIAVVAMGAVMVYCIGETLCIQSHHRLFESVVSSDWSVRVGLVRSSIQSRVPPSNPFFTIAGHAPAMRYYYYWYVLCAQPARLLGLSPRSVLVASTCWSGFAIYALIFLCVKHLGQSTGSARRTCLLALPLSCVLGLDIVPNLMGLFLAHRTRIMPEMEWWRSDRSPSILGSLLYAPHHVGGLVCASLGFLLLATLHRKASWGTRFLHGFTAGLCFAASVGTSTYMTSFFVLACLILAGDRIVRRQWPTAISMAVSGVFALLLSSTFIHEMLSNPGLSEHGSAHSRFLSIGLRNSHNAHGILIFIFKHFQIPYHRSSFLFMDRAFVILVLSFMEYGFLAIVLYRQFRTDFHSSIPLSEKAAALWAGFLGAVLIGLIVTSEPTQGVNDLGRHSGLLARTFLVIWATPMAFRYLQQRGSKKWTLLERRVLYFAGVMMALGLATQLWQVVMIRIYLPLVDAHLVTPRLPFVPAYDLAAEYYDIRTANEALSRILPSGAIVQGNPKGKYESILDLYLTRQTAAGDFGCESAFGGDPEACQAIIYSTQRLFGGFRSHQNAMPLEPKNVTPEALDFVCRQQSLTALIATSADPVWYVRSSWVWALNPLYSNRSVRVVACPGDMDGNQ